MNKKGRKPKSYYLNLLDISNNSDISNNINIDIANNTNTNNIDISNNTNTNNSDISNNIIKKKEVENQKAEQLLILRK